MNGLSETQNDSSLAHEEENKGEIREVLTSWIPAVRVPESCLRLRVHCVTYNLNSSTVTPIPQDLLHIHSFRKEALGDPVLSGSDVYAVATQENASVSTWEKAWTTALGTEYKKVTAVSLASIHLVIFLRKRLVSALQGADVSRVATGVGNIVGNKGGVAVSLCFAGNRKILVVSSHLAAHDGKVRNRNKDYCRIRQGLFNTQMGGTPRASPKRNQVVDELGSTSGQALTGSGCQQDATEAHHVSLWMGDLNYRVNGRRRAVQHALEAGMYEVLHANDQLGRERKKGGAFGDFNEGDISFPPTYKFDRHTDTYDTSSKNRIPSWTDRILWKTRSGVRPGTMLLQYYSSVSSIKVSDHKPVVALFDIDLNKIPENGSGDSERSSLARHTETPCSCSIQ